MANNQTVDAFPYLGFGVGLRTKHYEWLLSHSEWGVDWFEIISENFIGNEGYGRHVLDTIRTVVPIVMHGVSLNLGSTDALNLEYLKRLKQLADELNPKWVSDHLCWTGHAGINTHDLLPLPLNEESLEHTCNRVEQVQEILQRTLVIENPSSYLEFKQSTIPEWAFLSELVDRTGCRLLIDVNNIHVCSVNHGFDPYVYLNQLPVEAIVQCHLAGATASGNLLIDTHSKPITSEVWALYRHLVNKTDALSTMIEWDADLPEFPTLVAELNKARAIAAGDDIPEGLFQKETSDHPISNPIPV